jgi:hypothetical protein
MNIDVARRSEESGDSEPTGRSDQMSQGIDDFTIILVGRTDMAACDLRVYTDLEQLWRMVDRYRMIAPIAISLVDNQVRSIRVIRGSRSQAVGWQLADETTGVAPLGTEIEFPLTINVQDAKGNILKMRLQLGVVGTGVKGQK